MKHPGNRLRKTSGLLILIISILAVTMALAGCSTKDSDSDYGEAYDADYLMTDYADQLIRDGASTVIGTVEITGTEENYTVTVDQKKVVPSDKYDTGYYIADKNMTTDYPLGSDQGILVKKGSDTIVCTTEEFLADYSSDKEALYTVYLIGDTVELIQPLDPLEAIQAAD